MDNLSKLPRPFFVLAPMDDVTDVVFRQIVAECSPPDLYFTEFVNVDGLQSEGRPRLLKKLKVGSKDKPIVAQIWGLKPENFYEVSKQIAEGEFGEFVGIDINMGCPEKNVVSHGACSGLINNRELAVEIIKATQKGAAGKLPVSVKTRLGFNEVDYTWLELLLQQNLQMLTIHGRTRKEMSKVPANWEAIGEVRKLRDKLGSKTLIVGNGDVMTRAEGQTLAKTHQLDGIMIGRGIFHDPYLFCKDGTCKWEEIGEEERLELYKKHVQLFADTWKDGERAIHTLNKFCKIYINGFDGAKELRERLMAANSSEELIEILTDAY